MTDYYILEVITSEKTLGYNTVRVNIQDFGDRRVGAMDNYGTQKDGKSVQLYSVVTDDKESAFDKVAFALKERTNSKHKA